jgi:hypothetical protein
VVPDREVTDMVKAHETCERLRRLSSIPVESQESRMRSELAELASILQDVEEQDVARFVFECGLSDLLRVFDGHLNDPRVDESDVLFVLKIFALYGYGEGISRIPVVARLPRYHDGYLWSVIFKILARHNEYALPVVDALRDPLPGGFVTVACLDLCNQCCREGSLDAHPFDSDQGRQMFEAWLTDRDPDDFAISATAALPFLQPQGRDALFALALDHLNSTVRMEAAWACGHLGNTSGLLMLQEMCSDPNLSLQAQQYLEELGHEDMVPPDAREPDFVATAEMCRWLTHPMEFGRPPTHIELYDTRELFWPPTDDRRQVWLFKYIYNEPDQADSGFGMVGSVTFALFGEATADLSSEDVYGLHCAWELDCRGDARAPRKRSARAGRRILAKYNKGF